MATYTHFNVANPVPMDWVDAMGLAYGYNASLVKITNYDGTFTKAHGAFVIFNGQLINGAITSIERTSADGATVYESITGLSYSINTFLNASAKDRIPGVLNGADTVNGTSGPDELDGYAGPDVLKGGLGDDIYTVGAGDTVTENQNAGNDWVRASVSQYTLGANVENLGNDGGPGFHGIGNALDNTLSSTSGHATLEGRDGEDHIYGYDEFNVLIGGKDNDTYHVDSNNNTIVETADGGYDTIQTNVSGVHLATFVEELSLFGQHGLTGYGNDLSNILYGTNWDDELYGMDGEDQLDGGGGDNTLYGGEDDDVYIAYSSDTIVEYADEGIDTVETRDSEFTLAANVEKLTFTSNFEHTGYGNDDDNVITGNGKNDVLYGHGGTDWIYGKGGADTMVGGTGGDFYDVNNTGDVVVELADEGYDVVMATAATYKLSDNVEALEFHNAIEHLGVGNEGDNWLRGNTGKDTLFGLGGSDYFEGFGGGDQFVGGTGDDDYIVRPGDVVLELANEGIDTVQAITSTYTLTDNVENLKLYGKTGIGNDLDNDMDLIGAQGIELQGRGGNDTLRVNVSQHAVLDGGEGDDTVVLPGDLSDWSVFDRGDRVFLTSSAFLDDIQAVNVEHLKFNDGTLNVNDGAPMFDTAYYMTHNPDVWQAGANALDHFNTSGWHEGRNPNAYFDTAGYLAVNKDVAASGQNPLDHYHNTGWHEGRDPSANFDTTLYLINNPDVAASGVDPLLHFLQFGQAEGRQAYQAIGQNIVNGFDAQYYLLHNPDVAAAGVDPLQHFNTSGWHEGRNPNAWFDTAGYLAHYSDVAASGVNPLQHYEQFGWHEGRDPSAQFDTLGYLAANGDVAAAGVNPLDHFLGSGIYEGRTAVNDGLWH